jgi:hypothetical protein
MTAPAPYDRRILRHPEYTRSYHHYLSQGAPPDDAARLAYDWTRRTVPGLATPPNNRPMLIAGAIGGVVLLGLLGIAAVANIPADTVTTSPSPTPAEASATETDSPEPLPTSSPTPSPTSASPTSVPPPAVPTVVPPKPAAPAPKPPAPRPTTPAAKPPPACNPAYPDVCLKDGIGDYDCAGGTGDGPNYVTGPLKVRAPDPFDLDRNGDGIGCENG